MFKALALSLILIGSQAFAADLAQEESAFLQLVAQHPYSESAQDPDPLVDYWMTTVASTGSSLKEIQSKVAELDLLISNPGNEPATYSQRAQASLQFANAGLRQLQLTSQSHDRPTPRLLRERAMAAQFAGPAKALKAASQAVVTTPSKENEIARLKAERALQVTLEQFNKTDLALQQAALEKARSETRTLIDSYAARLDEETRTGFGAPVYQLTVLERVALENYTGGFYMAVNPALWSGKDLASLQPFVDYLSSALSHLPDYHGVVFRKIKMDDTQLAQHAVGQIVTYKGFTSTSIDDGFQSSARNVVLKIHSEHGHFIAPYSVHFSESEVLFDADTSFKVIARKTRDDGKIEIELVEARRQ